MRTKLPESITTVKQAEKFLTELDSNGESFHPEDDAHDIVWHNTEVSPKECDKLNKLMDDIHKISGFNPCEFLLKLMR